MSTVKHSQSYEMLPSDWEVSSIEQGTHESHQSSHYPTEPTEKQAGQLAGQRNRQPKEDLNTASEAAGIDTVVSIGGSSATSSINASRQLSAAELLVSYEPPTLLANEVEDVEQGQGKSRPIPPCPLTHPPKELLELHSNPNSPAPTSTGQHLSQRRRNSVFVRRYSSTDLSTDEVITLASDIFDTWDSTNKGYITVEEMTFKNKLDVKFRDAIGRVLAYDGTHSMIYRENLIECLAVLKSGDLSSKVKLLVQFMDHDGNKEISFEEIKLYLKVSDDKMLAKLGLLTTSSSSSSSTSAMKTHFVYEDLLSLFQHSDRGNEAISIFCNQILRLLTSSVGSHTNPGTTRPRRNSITQLVAENLGLGIGQRTSICTMLITNVFNPIHAGILYTYHSIMTMSQIWKFKSILIGLQIFLYIYYFMFHYQRDYPLAFCFAKGFGLNLRILSLLMYLTMARTTMGTLYANRSIRPVIPLGMNIEVHAFLGGCIFMHAFGHTFGHIAYKEMHTSQGFATAFTQASLLRGANWEDKLKGDGKTGFLLLAFLIIMTLTAIYRSRNSIAYRIFQYAHYLYLLYL